MTQPIPEQAAEPTRDGHRVWETPQLRRLGPFNPLAGFGATLDGAGES